MKRNGEDYDYPYKGSGYPDNGNLYFYLPNGEYEISSEAGGFAGTIDNADAAFIQSATGEVTVSVERGPVIIDDNGVTGYNEGGWAVSGLYAHYIIVGTSETNSIVITAGAPKITLRDVSVTTNAALSIKNAIVTMVLEGSNTLVSAEAAGLYVDKSASLTISEESTGSLYAVSTGGEGAGIGGNKGYGTSYGTPGPITINGGTIFAQGADFGSGIGGGSHGQANLVVNGGSVTALGGYLASGIGGGYGYEGNAGNITINGGTVKATGNGKSAGIGCAGGGGHDKFPAGLITITGGTIEAYAETGAGIGGSGDMGTDGRGPQIYVSGGSIKSYCFGEEIGRGEDNSYGPWDEDFMPYILNKPEGERVYAATLPGSVTSTAAFSSLRLSGAGDGITIRLSSVHAGRSPTPSEASFEAEVMALSRSPIFYLLIMIFNSDLSCGRGILSPAARSPPRRAAVRAQRAERVERAERAERADEVLGQLFAFVCVLRLSPAAQSPPRRVCRAGR